MPALIPPSVGALFPENNQISIKEQPRRGFWTGLCASGSGLWTNSMMQWVLQRLNLCPDTPLGQAQGWYMDPQHRPTEVGRSLTGGRQAVGTAMELNPTNHWHLSSSFS
ncbi:hypothetical protein FA13DRAFT_1727243 [Coprinellus micaceus]|uniref:Uncharacterized protein n=1 Tax=Coprinellus micaceus TaxID=71717 RepID=A0A4Y7TRS4_COPMI|nr:hypothetical protein FA13DRAFT_1727243 [Coprinellus micaceus]